MDQNHRQKRSQRARKPKRTSPGRAGERRVQITLGWLTVRQLEQQGLVVPASYYRVPSQMTFNDLEQKSIGFAALSFRIVRIETENGGTELLITSLDSKRFSPAALKRLYAMRWGIEASFRSLKYTVVPT